MKPPKLLAKIAVLSFFILFIIGFVAYRSGAFDKWLNSDTSPVQQTEMNSQVAIQNRIDSPPRTQKADTLVSINGFYMDVMAGSKSAPVFYPDTPKKKGKKTIMPSTKYMPLPPEKTVFDLREKSVYDRFDTSGSLKPKTESEKTTIMMSGSKSGAMIPVVVDRPKPIYKPIIQKKDTPVIKVYTPKPRRIIPSTKSGRMF